MTAIIPDTTSRHRQHLTGGLPLPAALRGTVPARPRRTYRPAPLPPAAPPASDPLSGRHVVITGMHYGGDDPTGPGPWTAALAEHLATRARTVTVVSGLPHDTTGTLDPHYAGLRHLVLPPPNGAGPVIVRRGHHIPAAWTPAGRARYELSFAIRAALTRLPHRPDLVIGVTPAPGGAAAAARIAARYRVPLALVVHSLHPGTAASALGRLPLTLERRALARADRIAVSTTDLTAPAIRAAGQPGQIVPLGPLDPDGGTGTGIVDRLIAGLLPRHR